MSEERSPEHSPATDRDDDSEEMSIHSETMEIVENLARSKIQGKMNEFIK